MRQVRTCDFCGGDATGLYEPLPSSIPDGPRLLLCSGCRDRLSFVVDPLLARLGEETVDDPGPAEEPAPEPEPTGGEAAASDGGPEPSIAASTGVNESRDASGRSQSERGGTPPGYRKVMRFLENRELPVARSEAVLLATDAYELSEDAVDAVIDHAVEYGRLREVDGQLKQ